MGTALFMIQIDIRIVEFIDASTKIGGCVNPTITVSGRAATKHRLAAAGKSFGDIASSVHIHAIDAKPGNCESPVKIHRAS
jgi:hypothetical protein